MCFFIMGQAKELLFKLLHFELHNARHLLREGSADDALTVLDRSREVARLLTSTWDVVTTISAEGFNQFRDHLDQASGQLSFMYRHVEFILGNKDRRLASAHRNVPHVWPYMEEALETPSLYDEVIALLGRPERALELPGESAESSQKPKYRQRAGPAFGAGRPRDATSSSAGGSGAFRGREVASPGRKACIS